MRFVELDMPGGGIVPVNPDQVAYIRPGEGDAPILVFGAVPGGLHELRVAGDLASVREKLERGRPLHDWGAALLATGAITAPRVSDAALERMAEAFAAGAHNAEGAAGSSPTAPQKAQKGRRKRRTAKRGPGAPRTPRAAPAAPPAAPAPPDTPDRP